MSPAVVRDIAGGVKMERSWGGEEPGGFVFNLIIYIYYFIFGFNAHTILRIWVNKKGS